MGRGSVDAPHRGTHDGARVTNMWTFMSQRRRRYTEHACSKLWTHTIGRCTIGRRNLPNTSHATLQQNTFHHMPNHHHTAGASGNLPPTPTSLAPSLRNADPDVHAEMPSLLRRVHDAPGHDIVASHRLYVTRRTSQT